MNESQIQKIIKAIDGAVGSFNEKIPGIQKRMAAELELLLKDIEVDSQGNIKASVANLKLIGRIKTKLDGLFRESGYIDNVTEYVKQFNEVTKLQNQYFTSLVKEFKPSPLTAEIKRQSIESTIESLTDAGIGRTVTQPISEILQKNITTGGSYSNLLNTLRDRILTNETGQGALERYSKQITTDALNQYSAQYTNAITNDLGLEWFVYTGALIATSRTFCEACIKKKYIHISEIQKLVEGDFEEFEDMDGEISDKTGLPEGMIAGTNAQNFHIYRGGYNCGHQLIPVDASSVPENIRQSIQFKTIYKSKGGGKIEVHEKAHKKDLANNKKVAQALVEQFDDKVVIMPHLQQQKNPELDINGRLADVKSPDPSLYKNIWRPVSEGIQRAQKQGATHTVVQLTKNYDLEGLIEGVRHGFKNAKAMEFVDILFPNNKAVRISRQEYSLDNYITKIKKGFVDDK